MSSERYIMSNCRRRQYFTNSGSGNYSVCKGLAVVNGKSQFHPIQGGLHELDPGLTLSMQIVQEVQELDNVHSPSCLCPWLSKGGPAPTTLSRPHLSWAGRTSLQAPSSMMQYNTLCSLSSPSHQGSEIGSTSTQGPERMRGICTSETRKQNMKKNTWWQT